MPLSDHPPTELESALDAFTHAIEAWDPDTSPGVEEMLAALRELHLKFDPRKDRVSAAMCMTSMKLLESLQRSGRVELPEAIGAMGELSLGLREALVRRAADAGVGRPTPRDAMVVLGGGPKTAGSSGLSLAIGGGAEQTLDEVMVRMNMLTRAQADEVLAAQQSEDPQRPFGELAIELGHASEMTVESALRLQARARGETPERRPADDAWGNSPL